MPHLARHPSHLRADARSRSHLYQHGKIGSCSFVSRTCYLALGLQLPWQRNPDEVQETVHSGDSFLYSMHTTALHAASQLCLSLVTNFPPLLRPQLRVHNICLGNHTTETPFWHAAVQPSHYLPTTENNEKNPTNNNYDL